MVERMLDECDIDLESKNQRGETPLTTCCFKGNNKFYLYIFLYEINNNFFTHIVRPFESRTDG